MRTITALAAGATILAALSAQSREAGAARAARLGAEQIVAKSVQASGGEEAWRKVQTLIWSGHLESERIPEHRVAFFLEEQRPNKSRFEIMGLSVRSVRVVDGTHGWTMRPGQSGIPEVESLSPTEVKFARDAAGLEGPLVDAAAQGGRVELEGREQLEGSDCYRLTVTLASGERQAVWVDAKSFLLSRYDRTSYNKSGMKGTVSVYYRAYKAVDGLQLPALVEIGGAAGLKRDKMIIEKVEVNSPINERQFARPGPLQQRAEVTIGGPQQFRGPVSPPSIAPTAPVAKTPTTAAGGEPAPK
jgi:hypothetical protein